MLVKVYQNNDNPKKVVKTLGTPIQIDATIKDPLEIINPEFFVVYNASLLSYNYLEANGRYFYMRPEVDPGGSMRLHCSEDFLMSWSSGILDSPCVCARSATKYNGFIDDPRYPVLKRQTIECKKIFELSNDDTEVLAYVE